MMAKSYIGCSLTHDGMGARFQRILTAMILSYSLEEHGIEYLHLPMAYEGFGLNFKQGDKIRQKGYPTSHSTEYIKNAQKWDDEINYNGTTIHDIDINDFKIVMGDQLSVFSTLVIDIEKNSTKGKIYLFDSLHNLIHQKLINSELFNTYRNKLNDKFDLKKSRTNEIMVHIRRKDIINHSSRYLPDSYYLSLLKSFNKEDVVITTQRDGFNTDVYSDYKIIYDDEISEIGIIKRMVNAKILVLSVSSFSYTAGILNDGIVYVPKQLNKSDKLNNWI